MVHDSVDSLLARLLLAKAEHRLTDYWPLEVVVRLPFSFVSLCFGFPCSGERANTKIACVSDYGPLLASINIKIVLLILNLRGWCGPRRGLAQCCHLQQVAEETGRADVIVA